MSTPAPGQPPKPPDWSTAELERRILAETSELGVVQVQKAWLIHERAELLHEQDRLRATIKGLQDALRECLAPLSLWPSDKWDDLAERITELLPVSPGEKTCPQ
jgi:hypothetical protein